MTDPKIRSFISGMVGFFGEPYRDPDGQTVKLLIRHLNRYSAATLDKLVEHFAMSRAYKSWPMPAEIVREANKIQDRLYPDEAPVRTSARDEEMAAERLANDLMRSKLGVQAANGGWLEALFEHCKRTGALPEGEEAIDRVMNSQMEIDAKWENTLNKIANDEGWSPGSANVRTALLGFYEKARERRADREDRIREWGEYYGVEV